MSCWSPPPHHALALRRHWVDSQGETQLFKEISSAGAFPGQGVRGASGHQYMVRGALLWV